MGLQKFARVALSDLCFDAGSVAKHRTLSQKNVARLRRIYQIEGCRRAEPENFIDVVIDNSTIDQSSGLIESPASDWSSVPILQNTRVECLNGLHRVRAAETFLAPNDKWWIVRVHRQNPTSHANLVTQLLEQTHKEAPHTDGEIFHKIRKYCRDGDEVNEQKWWARLTRSKWKDVKQLLRTQEYREAFDRLLPWPALWKPLQLGTLHRLLTMHCEEEVVNALIKVAEVWTSIHRGIPEMEASFIFDDNAIARLELLAPVYSSLDATAVEEFVKQAPEALRPQLKDNLSRLDWIPTINSVFEDLKYLEPAAKVLRTIMDPSSNGLSICQSFMRCYFHPDTADIRVDFAQNDPRSVTLSDPIVRQELGYQQLWLFALRHFPNLVNITTKRSSGTMQQKPLNIEPSPHLQRELAQLAYDLGYRTTAIERFRNCNVNFNAARQLIAQFGQKFENADHVANLICQALNTAEVGRESVVACDFFRQQPLAQADRCGRPCADDHDIDRPSLFLPQMYCTPATTGDIAGPSISTRFRKHCMFSMFFALDKLPEREEISHLLSRATTDRHITNSVTLLSEQLTTEGQGRAEETSNLRQQLAAVELQLESDRGKFERQQRLQSEEVKRRVEEAISLRQQLAAAQLQLQNERDIFERQRVLQSNNISTLQAEISTLQTENRTLKEVYEQHKDEGMSAYRKLEQELHLANQQLEERIRALAEANASKVELERKLAEASIIERSVLEALQSLDKPWIEADKHLSCRVIRRIGNTSAWVEFLWPADQAAKAIELLHLCDPMIFETCKYFLGKHRSSLPTHALTEELLQRYWSEQEILWVVENGADDALMRRDFEHHIEKTSRLLNAKKVFAKQIKRQKRTIPNDVVIHDRHAASKRSRSKRLMDNVSSSMRWSMEDAPSPMRSIEDVPSPTRSMEDVSSPLRSKEDVFGDDTSKIYDDDDNPD